MEATSTCGNKARLAAEYQADHDAYLRAMSDLLSAVGNNTQGEYERLNRIAQEAVWLAMRRSKNLHLHIYQHGC